ncbi:MAG: EI24 domain-containing protein [Flavobacteriales bacterium]
MRHFALGIDGFFRAFGFCLRHGMWWLFLAPIALWALLAYGLAHALEAAVDAAGDWAAARLAIPAEADDASWWADLKAWLNGARDAVLKLVLRLAVGYLLFVANKYIVLVLLSPLMAYASERAEEILTGRAYPFSFAQLMRDALRGALIALRNGVLELAVTMAIWLASLVLPILTPLSLALLFAVSAYFYGFSMFDYVFERRRMRIGDTARAVNRRLGAVLANGACFSLLMKVPLLGLMLAPAMASVGASITMVRLEGAGRQGRPQPGPAAA